MKKIISMVLVLCFAFALGSCGKKSGAVDEIASIVNQSNPTKIVTIVNYTLGETTFVSEYITQKDIASGKSQFDYNYQRLAIPGEDEISNSSIKNVTGTVYCDADGNLSGSSFNAGSATGYLPYSLSINAESFASFEIGDDGKTMSANISADKAEDVFGTPVSAEGDISLTVTTNGSYLYNVEINYVAAETGAVVSIRTSYDYTKITLNF
jgi:hypothetical protein